MARFVLGACLWLMSASLLWAWSWSEEARPWRRTADSVSRFLVTPARHFDLTADPAQALEAGPVFLMEAGRPRTVGDVRVEEGKPSAALFMSPSSDLGRSHVLRFHRMDASWESALSTLVPPDKRAELMAEVVRGFEQKKPEIMAALEPGLQALFAGVQGELVTQLRTKSAERWPEIQKIVDRHRRDYLDADLAKLGQDVAWPMFRREAIPLTDRIVREMAGKVSVWRFGWRYLYDRSGLGDDSMEKEWKRFVDEDALPIFESHVPEFANLTFRTLERTITDERTQRALERAFERVTSDPEFQQVVSKVAQDVFRSPELHAAFAKAAEKPVVRESFEKALTYLEPALTQAGTALLTDEAGGLSPELTRVLRRHVLGKDRVWYTLEPATATQVPEGVLRVEIATSAEDYPLPGFTSNG